MPEKPMTTDDAIRVCRETGLSGWEFVAFAQRLVAERMSYSYFNSIDPSGWAALPAALYRVP